MKVGVPKEIKTHEYRVGLVPSSVHELTQRGHEVFIESNAGNGCGFSNDNYKQVGATILSSAEEIFNVSDMIIKVKEPQHKECMLLRKEQILFTFLHLAADKQQTEDLINSESIAIAYETVTSEHGDLPLLSPMSEVAGRMSVQVGAVSLQKSNKGSGLLLGGVPGVSPGNVLIIGGGVVGINAASMAIGLGANVTIIDKSIKRLREIDFRFGNKIKTLYSTLKSIEESIINADLIIGAVLIPGSSAPKLISKEMLNKIKKGTVLVDVAIDQGGCFETSKPTTHENPTYIVNDIVHYCVANMPGAVSRTSAFALNNATLPFILEISEKGYKKALRENSHLMAGLNIYKGIVTCKPVAESLNYKYKNPENLIK